MTPDYTREIEQLKLRLSRLEQAVNAPQKIDAPNTKGKSGDIRIIKDSNGIAAIEIKGEDEWYTTVSGTFIKK